MTKPITMYLAMNWYRPRIEVVQVAKLTPKFYQQADCTHMQARSSQRESVFSTWEEARDWLLEIAEANVQSGRRQLELAQSKQGNIKGWKKP
jgi:hypothetical protein